MIKMLITIIQGISRLLLAKVRVARASWWAALQTKDCLYLLHLQEQNHVRAYRVIALEQSALVAPQVKLLTLSAAEYIEHKLPLKSDSRPDNITDQVMAAALQQLPGTLDQFVIDYRLLNQQQVRWVATTIAEVKVQQQQWPQAVVLEPRADAHARALRLLFDTTDCVIVMEINRGHVEISWHCQRQVVQAIAADIFDAIETEIKTLLAQHRVEQSVTQVIICGELATTAVAELLQKTLALPVIIADMRKHFTYADDVNLEQLNQTPFFTLAGLALRNTETVPINLLPWRQKLLRQQRFRFFRQLAMLGILAGVITIGIYGYCQHLIAEQQVTNQKLQQQLQQLQPTVQQVKTLQETQKNINSNLAWLQQLQWQRDRWYVLLSLLAQTMPDSLGLTALTAQDQEVVITGMAQDSVLLQQWLTQLQAISLFSKVQLTTTTAQQFTITLTWKK